MQNEYGMNTEEFAAQYAARWKLSSAERCLILDAVENWEISRQEYIGKRMLWEFILPDGTALHFDTRTDAAVWKARNHDMIRESRVYIEIIEKGDL